MRGSLSREVSLSPEGEARERRRSVKFRGEVERIEEGGGRAVAEEGVREGEEVESNGDLTSVSNGETAPHQSSNGDSNGASDR